jgi:hypothetical protein
MKKKLPKRTTKTKARAGKRKSVSPKSALASSVALVDQLAASKTGTYLKPAKPADNLGVLWVARANGRVLTSTGMLQLARARNAAGIAIDKLLPFAENEIERALIDLIYSTRPNLFAGCNDPLKALFLLRAIHIPIICRGLLNQEYNTDEGKLWLGSFVAYSVAYERTHLERSARAIHQAHLNQMASERLRKPAAIGLGKEVRTWFDEVAEGYEFWISRFDQWLEYAMRSLDHCMDCQSSDYRQSWGNMKQSIHLGILKCLDELPEERFASFIDQTNATVATRRMYNKHAKKRSTKPRHLKFDSWLIECWPAVLEYGWSYKDLQRVAIQKFNELSYIKLTENPKELKKRCNKLHLVTSAKGQKKYGRPRDTLNPIMPPMYVVALAIDGLQDFRRLNVLKHRSWL